MTSRVQLALNVTDIDSATEFYSRLFNTAPNKVRDGYANFAVEDPPLKLVLLENSEPSGALNHLGVELADSAAVEEATVGFAERGLETRVSSQEACCHAVQDKVYVTAPEVPIGMWEFYTVLDDAPENATNSDGVCCAPTDGSSNETDATEVAGACGPGSIAGDDSPCCG